jgi:hypothetical protein
MVMAGRSRDHGERRQRARRSPVGRRGGGYAFGWYEDAARARREPLSEAASVRRSPQKKFLIN